MPRLRQCNTSWAFHVPAPPTSVDAQHRRQTDTSTLVRRARHTDAAILSLAAVSGRHRLQAGCAPLPMPACMVWRHGIFPTTSSSSLISTASTSSRRHPFHAASDPTHTAVHCRRVCISCGRMPPLEQSATQCHLSSNAHCFSESPQNFSFSYHFLHNC